MVVRGTSTILEHDMAYLIATTTIDITDPTGDSDLFIPAGSQVYILSDEGVYAIAEHGDVTFPVDYDEIEIGGS
jgi:hypothetical protein